ncbi:hypothetical protein Ddye_027618 [Dipteronia dyeriana]|uniref:KIB1-4 beta-propeller domain-containing protein n=1 Tax=Dipteronia dyeriana TaxID=168575 RepID=A0AAD9TPW2_9ROSI|nr:hypothetical protein Ddye_027618 [Dipteronia dyeriana]
MIYRCERVCVSWLSVVRSSLPRYLLLSNVGMLMDRGGFFEYMENQHEDYFKNMKSCVLFDLFTKRIREISLPEESLKGRWFTGSSSGRGDRYWTDVENLRSCRDAIFYKDYFYAIDPFGKFVAIHVKSLVPPVEYRGCSAWKSHIQCLARHQQHTEDDTNYMVEFDGDLLLVIRKTLGLSRASGKRFQSNKETVDFEVYKWNPTEKKWSRMIGIGNNVILLGKYSSISIPVSPPCSPRDHGGVVDCMWCGELKGNCIYFIDDLSCNGSYYTSHRPQHEAGVYNMTNHRIDRFPESWPIWTSPLNCLRPRLW